MIYCIVNIILQMAQTIEELREKQRERYRKKHNVPPERYVNGRSHPDNKEYHRELKKRYYYAHKEELSEKKKIYYQKKKALKLSLHQNGESRTIDEMGNQGENTGDRHQGQVPSGDGQTGIAETMV